MPDRAFCKKTSKARSKPEQRGRARPCLLQKSGKGTVKIGAKRSCPTVPFAKNEQKHGRNHSKAVVPDRAFCKKAAKARSKSQRSRRSRPCLLQKSGKGTVKIVRQTAQPTVPFAKKRQRHGQNCGAEVAPASECSPRPRLMQKTRTATLPPKGLRDNATMVTPAQMNSVIAPHPALIANRPFHTDTARFAWILHNLNKKTLLVLT